MADEKNRLSEEEAAVMRQVLDQQGPTAVAERIGISEATGWRAAARGRVVTSIARAIRDFLRPYMKALQD